MSDLLALAVESHGGLDRWNRFRTIDARLSIGGAIWSFKRQAGLFDGVVFSAELHGERVSYQPFTAPNLRSVFVPGRLSLETLDGELKTAWDRPRSHFSGLAYEAPWEPLHAVYFASCATWTYLTQPFLYTYPGFSTEEIAPWEENGEVWRRLKVTFPDYIATHTREQITYFGSDGLMRRHDYDVEVLNGASGANYPLAYKSFEGIQVPTARRIFGRGKGNEKIPEPLLVAIDIAEVTFR